MSRPDVTPVLNARRITTESGVNDIVTPAKNVLWFAAHGTVEVAFADALIREADQMLLAHGKLYLFADTSGVVDYEPQFREAMTHWFRRRRSQLTGVHVLIANPLVKMGVGMINLLLGGLLTTYSDRAKFDAQYAVISRANAGR